VTARKRGSTRAWSVAWIGGAALGVANGVARETLYKDIGERRARQVSAATLMSALGAYFWLLERRWPLASSRQALRVGVTWVALTVGFEFAFGRLVDRRSWRELLENYDLAHGEPWPLVLAFEAAAPTVVRRIAAAR